MSKESSIAKIIDLYNIKSAGDIQDAFKDLFGKEIKKMLKDSIKNKDISEIEKKIIKMYARGMTTSEISEFTYDVYGFDVDERMVSSITDKVLPLFEEWRNRPLLKEYPVVLVETNEFVVRKSKKDVYTIIGIDAKGYREVLSVEISDGKSSFLDDVLKSRGLQLSDISGLKKSNLIKTLKAQYKKLNFSSEKELKKKLYLAVTEVAKKWSKPVKNWESYL